MLGLLHPMSAAHQSYAASVHQDPGASQVISHARPSTPTTWKRATRRAVGSHHSSSTGHGPAQAATGSQSLRGSGRNLAGSQLTAPDDGSWRMAKIDAGEETSWAAGQLVFAGKSLSEVAGELNRRSDKKVVIVDATVGRAVISGSFDAGDVEGFVRAVQGYGLARVAKETNEEIELAAP